MALLGGSEAQIARALAAGATTVDDLASRSGLPVSTVLGTLTLLEIRGLVVGAYGRYRTSGVLAGGPPRFALSVDRVLPLAGSTRALPAIETAARRR